MAYTCPKCGDPVSRSSSDNAVSFGLIGLMFYAAFGDFICNKCGMIRRNEFPKEVQSKMIGGSIFFVIGAIALLIGFFWFLVYYFKN